MGVRPDIPDPPEPLGGDPLRLRVDDGLEVLPVKHVADGDNVGPAVRADGGQVSNPPFVKQSQRFRG